MEIILSIWLDLLAGCWVFVFTLTTLEILRTARRDPWRHVAALAGLFFVAFGLHLLFATWGPGDYYMRQSGVFTGNFDFMRGNASRALNRMLFTVFPSTDRTIVYVSLFCGAAAPVVLALFLRAAGWTFLRSFLAGCLLATQPILIRFSGDNSRQMHIVLLGIISLWGLGLFLRSPRSRYLVLFVVSAWLGYRDRPEAIVLLAVSALFLLSRQPRRPRWFAEKKDRQALVAWIVLLALNTGTYLLTRLLAPEDVSMISGFVFEPRLLFTPLYHVWLDPFFTSFVVILLFALGTVLSFKRSDRIGLWAAASLIPAGFTSVTPSWGPSIAEARYQAVQVLLFVVPAALALAWPMEAAAARGRVWRGRAGVALVGVLLLVTSIGPVGAVAASRTIDHEYRFLRAAILELPPGARLFYSFSRSETLQGSLMTPLFLPEMLGRADVEWAPWPPPEEDDGRPSFYYHAPICSIDPGYLAEFYPDTRVLSVCRDAFGRTRRDPAITETIPALHFDCEVFTVDEIPVGFYAVRRPST